MSKIRKFYDWLFYIGGGFLMFCWVCQVILPQPTMGTNIMVINPISPTPLWVVTHFFAYAFGDINKISTDIFWGAIFLQNVCDMRKRIERNRAYEEHLRQDICARSSCKRERAMPARKTKLSS